MLRADAGSVAAGRWPGAVAGLITVALTGWAGPALAGCPDPAEMMERLRSAGIEHGSRTAVHQRQPPWDAYRAAADQLDEVVVRRDGNEGFAVSFVEVPAPLVWRAINDFEYQVEGGYLPLRFAAVVWRSADGQDVHVVQSFKQMGMGRWWYNDVRVNRPLTDSSRGVLFESFWKDKMGELEGLLIPQEVQDLDVPGIVSTTGAWLVADLGDGCSAVEYFNIAEIGGFLGKVQWVVARRAIRSTLRGMTELARDYAADARDDAADARDDAADARDYAADACDDAAE